MATVGSIGIGLFILIIIWIISLTVFVFSVKYQNNNIGWITVLLATLFTIVLVAIPTEKQPDQSHIENVEKDYYLIYKKVLLTFVIASAIVGSLAFFILHCIEPVRIKPLKNF